MANGLNPQVAELLAEPTGVGIKTLPTGELVTNGNNFSVHINSFLVLCPSLRELGPRLLGSHL